MMVQTDSLTAFWTLSSPQAAVLVDSEVVMELVMVVEAVVVGV